MSDTPAPAAANGEKPHEGILRLLRETLAAAERGEVVYVGLALVMQDNLVARAAGKCTRTEALDSIALLHRCMMAMPDRRVRGADGAPGDAL